MTAAAASISASQSPISPATQAFLATAETLATHLGAASSHPRASGDPIPQHQVQVLLTALPKLLPAHQPAALAWLTLRAAHSAQRAWELFEELQLRAGLSQIFPTFNLHGEQSWRAAAQTRLLLQTDLTPLPRTLASESFWQNPDTHWLAGVDHTNEYFNKESLELLLPLLAYPTQSGITPAIQTQITNSAYKIKSLQAPTPTPSPR